MPRVTIDGRGIEVPEGTTILEAARRVGVDIPTFCHLRDADAFTSCMICVVKETGSGRFLPSCSAPVADGMVIESDSEAVRGQRRTILELLLSEHTGDCEGPCQVTCPAHMDIPGMIRLLAGGRHAEAAARVREAIALPGVVGHVCSAPCERGCRRGRLDAPVGIRLLERFAATAPGEPVVPTARTGRRIAVVGAGPAGLAAAYYAALAGHACTVFDDHEQPGGQLRYRTSREALPLDVLERDVETVRRLGVEFRMKTRIEPGAGLERLKREYDAVVLAPGRYASATLGVWNLATCERGFRVDAVTFQTSDPSVFAGGEAVHAGQMAVRAMAHGRQIAHSLAQWLAQEPMTGLPRRFNSRMGRLRDGELEVVRALADGRGPVGAASPVGYAESETVAESARCLHCDCRRARDCRLREYAERYGAGQRRYSLEGRLEFGANHTHPSVIFEPGKCIKCGICVRLSGASDGCGLVFTGRGYETRLAVPFNATLAQALGSAAAECVRQCPTGALAWTSS